MKSFKVVLTRAYLVTVNAESEEDAKRYAEFYFGNCLDLSKEEEREKYRFSLESMEMVINDAEMATE
ncbi:MAG: hypothetical protein GF315_00995 [candidate division Zixibacteria bacterium]|nr:hypothetical protein [candidate division Zixibacteria bacterium]